MQVNIAVVGKVRRRSLCGSSNRRTECETQDFLTCRTRSRIFDTGCVLIMENVKERGKLRNNFWHYVRFDFLHSTEAW
jgi:hypothetical protein